MKEDAIYMCVSFPLASNTFTHLWEKWSSLDCEEQILLTRKVEQCVQLKPRVKTEVTDDCVKDANNEFNSEILEHYTIGGKLGEGAFGWVHEATQKSTGVGVAIKVINDSAENGKKSQGKMEAGFMKLCKHGNIVELLALFETSAQCCLVMELFELGDLFTWIETTGRIEESVVQALAKDIASAVMYLHSLKIVHRDIKPENAFLLTRPDGKMSLKIGDFGEAVRVTRPLYDFTGTMLYMAPEMWLEVGYGTKIDVWAMGITVFLMLSGYMPFDGSSEYDTMCLIVKGKIDFNHPHWVALNISAQAVKFVKYLLRTKPCLRPSAKKVFRHQWLNPTTPQN